MAKFIQLSNEKVKDREAEISKYWKEIDLLNESVKQREDGPEYIFAVAEGMRAGVEKVGRAGLAASQQNQSLVKKELALALRNYARQYPYAGYGKRFWDWASSGSLEAYKCQVAEAQSSRAKEDKNRLADAITVDYDERRDTLILMVSMDTGPWLPARSLSDGTKTFR